MSAYERYQELQGYVNWTADDARRVQSAGPLVTPFFAALVDDFYAEIQRHPQAARVITGGDEQIARLKQTLIRWLEELFAGPYDRAYVERRWRVGDRHVEIGLDQVYTNAALSRLRRGLLATLEDEWRAEVSELLAVRESINTLLDLDLAIIEDAYQTEFQRRQAEADRLATIGSLFENTLDGLIILDRSGRIVTANPAACSDLGLPRGALDGQRLESIVLCAGDQKRPTVRTDFFTGKRSIQECTFVRGDGAQVTMDCRAVEDFTPGLDLISLRDTTARKQAEERARLLERLAAIGETMAALVHESRNALQRGKASLEMLRLEVEDRPEALQFVARAERAQDDLHQLFEEVRQWAAPLVLRRQTCNLRELWKEVWYLVGQAHPARTARLVEDVSCEPVCSADPFAMGQVFRNIFENALEASPAGASVTIRCATQSDGPGEQIVITISDQGPGLSAEQQRRIFEPFFTTKAKGTGLGMAIAQRIVYSHGGTIQAHSGPGAQIEIRLPRGEV